MITLNQSMRIEKNYVIRILIDLLFILKLKIFFEDIAVDVKKWFATSNYHKNDKRPLPIGMNKRVYVFFKDELGEKIMKEFVALRGKTYAYWTDDDDEKKKAKGTNKSVIRRELMFENY